MMPILRLRRERRPEIFETRKRASGGDGDRETLEVLEAQVLMNTSEILNEDGEEADDEAEDGEEEEEEEEESEDEEDEGGEEDEEENEEGEGEIKEDEEDQEGETPGVGDNAEEESDSESSASSGNEAEGENDESSSESESEAESEPLESPDSAANQTLPAIQSSIPIATLGPSDIPRVKEPDSPLLMSTMTSFAPGDVSTTPLAAVESATSVAAVAQTTGADESNLMDMRLSSNSVNSLIALACVGMVQSISCCG
jgi:segregation and condensation protein B